MTVTNLEQWAVERLAGELQPRFQERKTLVADMDEVRDVEPWQRGRPARRADSGPTGADHALAVGSIHGFRVHRPVGQAR